MSSRVRDALDRLVGEVAPRGVGLVILQLFGSRMTGQAAGFLAAILVARALGPEGFGPYSLALTLALVLAAVPGGGLDLAVVRVSARYWSQRPERGWGVLLVGGLARGGAALVLTIAGLVAAWALNSPLLDRPELALPVACSALAGFATAVTDYVLAALQARERFGRMLVLNLIGAALKLAPVAVLAALGTLTLPSALLAFLLTAYVTGSIGALLIRRGWGESARWDRTVAAELLHFSRWLVPTAALGVLTAGVDVAVLAHLAGAEITGVYTSGRTLASPLAIAGGTVGAVLLPRLARLASRHDLYRAARGIGVRVAALTALAAAALVAAAPLAVPLVFGEAYAETVVVFQLLIGAYTVEVITWPALIVLLALDRPDLTAGLSLVVLLVTMVGVVLVAPSFGAAGTAAVVLMSRITVGLLYLAVVWAARPAAGVSDRAQRPVTP
jgi:O-antigen/teichoic acid export membrane protein